MKPGTPTQRLPPSAPLLKIRYSVRKVVIATGQVSTIAGVAGTMGSRDGMGPVALFAGPQGLALDGAGNAYVGGIRGVPAGVDLWRFDLNPASVAYDPQLRPLANADQCAGSVAAQRRTA